MTLDFILFLIYFFYEFIQGNINSNLNNDDEVCDGKMLLQLRNEIALDFIISVIDYFIMFFSFLFDYFYI